MTRPRHTRLSGLEPLIVTAENGEEVYADNAAGIALYTRHGFVEEGRHRDFAFRDGAFVDALSMARIRR